MNVISYKKEDKNTNNFFLQELQRFADDYGLTLEEAATIISNMAARNVKKSVLSNA